MDHPDAEFEESQRNSPQGDGGEIDRKEDEEESHGPCVEELEVGHFHSCAEFGESGADADVGSDEGEQGDAEDDGGEKTDDLAEQGQRCGAA